MASRARPKVKIGISIDADLYDWIVARAGTGGEFASISHAIERCVVQFQRTMPAERRAQVSGEDADAAAHS